MAERPLGITIISILGFIGAVLTVIGGIALSSLGTFLTGMLGPLGALGALAGIALIVIGIVQFVISYGLWKMKKWAFYIEMILLALGIVLGILSLVAGSFTTIISIIIEALIIYYMYTKRTLFS